MDTPVPKTIVPPYYPIVYVRGYAMTSSEREEVFYDGYYGFAATSVEKRQAVQAAEGAAAAKPGNQQVADVFEGQMIRFMKLGDYGYADSVNAGLDYSDNPARSIWVSRFYDQDFIGGGIRSIEDHAQELANLVLHTIPDQLEARGMHLGPNRKDYKVILLAHSMGGLVCRCLIQKLLPALKTDPKSVVHRFVTMGSPHGGIDLGSLPNFIERAVVQTFNPFDSSIFQEPRMRDYLNLQKKNSKKDYVYDLNSLGDSGFPVKRCLCIIGSDYSSYSGVRHLTGVYSDGLVRQDRAFVVAGPRSGKEWYEADQKSFTANVHRAHSGYRGIVNSYESFENIQRFLFGDVKADICLSNLQLGKGAPAAGEEVFYDFEFRLSIRGTNTYLHQRRQDPCENAIRLSYSEVENAELLLHTAFLNSKLARKLSSAPGAALDPNLHFLLSFRVVEYRVKKGWLFDTSYPGMTIYSESAEMTVAYANDPTRPTELQYDWLSDMEGPQTAARQDDNPRTAQFTFKLRNAGKLQGDVIVRATRWPDPDLTQD